MLQKRSKYDDANVPRMIVAARREGYNAEAPMKRPEA
jgi:hypothetical protein